jgi:hypothetical protein
MKFISLALLTFLNLVLATGLNAQGLSLMHFQNAEVLENEPMKVSLGFSAGDIDTFGGRFSAVLTDNLRGFVELTHPDLDSIDGDIAGGLGAYYEIENSLDVQTGVRGKLHTLLDEFGDLYTIGLAGVVGGKIDPIASLSWYGFAGLDYIKYDRSNFDDDETEPAIGLGLNYNFTSKYVGSFEINNSYDDTYAGVGFTSIDLVL